MIYSIVQSTSLSLLYYMHYLADGQMVPLSCYFWFYFLIDDQPIDSIQHVLRPEWWNCSID